MKLHDCEFLSIESVGNGLENCCECHRLPRLVRQENHVAQGLNPGLPTALLTRRLRQSLRLSDPVKVIAGAATVNSAPLPRALGRNLNSGVLRWLYSRDCGTITEVEL